MGRPSKLEPRRRERLCAALRGGNHYDTACAYAGIGYTTFRRWMRAGAKAKSGEYRQFWQSVQEAVKEGERRILKLWRKQCPTDARACRDLLARRHPEKWGSREKKEVTHKGAVGQVVEVVVRNRAEAAALLEYIGRGDGGEKVEGGGGPGHSANGRAG
jgi:hypothetical protein